MCFGFNRRENRDMSLQVIHSNGAEVSPYPQLTSFSSYVSSGHSFAVWSLDSGVPVGEALKLAERNIFELSYVFGEKKKRNYLIFLYPAGDEIYVHLLKSYALTLRDLLKPRAKPSPSDKYRVTGIVISPISSEVAHYTVLKAPAATWRIPKTKFT